MQESIVTQLPAQEPFHEPEQMQESLQAPDGAPDNSVNSGDADELNLDEDDTSEVASDEKGTLGEDASDGDEWERALHSVPPIRRLPQRVSMPARISFLGLIVVAVWWTWPRAGAETFPFSRDNDNTEPQQSITTSMAVVNPANVVHAASEAIPPEPLVTVDATQQAELFNNLVVVTPTSTRSTVAITATVGGDPREAQSGQEEADSGISPAAAAPTLEVSRLERSASDEAGPDPLLETENISGSGSDDPTVISLEIPENTTPQPAVEMRPAEPGNVERADDQQFVLVPTATPMPESSAAGDTEGNAASESAPQPPRVEVIQADNGDSTPTATPTAPPPTATPTALPSPTAPSTGPGQLWSTFTPRPAETNDHFWIANPFEGFAANRLPSPNYQFGSTGGNRYRPHHGVDISNPLGTPVQAGVEGEVIHAGPDEELGPYADFYGQAVVIRLEERLPVAGGEMDVYVLYGHLSEVRVTPGQRVDPSDVVGLVGMTGIAIGPHLHVEVRLGANTYAHNVNPFLWLKPAPGNGAVAVRVLTEDGRTWAGARVSIARFEGSQAVWARQIETYLDTENIGPDPAWGENGALGDVPAGTYYLVANIGDESRRTEFTVEASETSFVEIRVGQ